MRTEALNAGTLCAAAAGGAGVQGCCPGVRSPVRPCAPGALAVARTRSAGAARLPLRRTVCCRHAAQGLAAGAGAGEEPCIRGARAKALLEPGPRAGDLHPHGDHRHFRGQARPAQCRRSGGPEQARARLWAAAGAGSTRGWPSSGGAPTASSTRLSTPFCASRSCPGSAPGCRGTATRGRPGSAPGRRRTMAQRPPGQAVVSARIDMCRLAAQQWVCVYHMCGISSCGRGLYAPARNLAYALRRLVPPRTPSKQVVCKNCTCGNTLLQAQHRLSPCHVAYQQESSSSMQTCMACHT